MPYRMLCELIVNIELNVFESASKWVDVITIVAINHNFRNTNHNCHKKPQLSRAQPQLSQSDQPQMEQLQ